MKWTLSILALITSLATAAVAGWFSIVGIMAIFAGAAIPAAIMGGVLEVGKLVTAAWLKYNWKNTALGLKTYLSLAVFVLMFITSMGIFGYLSKAHIEQGAPVANNSAKIARIEQKIEKENSKIADAENVIDQLDQQVRTLIEYDKISGPDGSRAVRSGQEPQRNDLRIVITNSENKIDELLDQKFELAQKVREFEVEVGPIKYIAELIYDDPKSNFDAAVRAIIIIFIFVFDPLAVFLLLAANQSFIELTNNNEPTRKKEKRNSSKSKDDDRSEKNKEIGMEDGGSIRNSHECRRSSNESVPQSSEQSKKYKRILPKKKRKEKVLSTFRPKCVPKRSLRNMDMDRRFSTYNAELTPKATQVSEKTDQGRKDQEISNEKRNVPEKQTDNVQTKKITKKQKGFTFPVKPMPKYKKE